MSLPGGIVPGIIPPLSGVSPTSGNDQKTKAEQQAEAERQAVEQQRQAAYQAAQSQFEGAKSQADAQLQAAYEAAQQKYQQAVEEARNIGKGGTPEEQDAAQAQRDAAIQAAKQQLDADRQAAKEAHDSAVQQAQEAHDGAVQAADQSAEQALQSIDQKAQQQQQIDDQTAQQQEQQKPPGEDINQPYVPGQVPGSVGIGQTAGLGDFSPTQGAIPKPTVPPIGATPSGQDVDQNGIDDALELYNHAISQGRPGIIGPSSAPAGGPPNLVDQSVEAVLARAGITLPPRTPGREYTPQVGGQRPSFAQPNTPNLMTEGDRQAQLIAEQMKIDPTRAAQLYPSNKPPALQDAAEQQRALIAEQMKIDPTWAPQLYGSPALSPADVQEQRDIANAVNAPRASEAPPTEPAVPYQPNVPVAGGPVTPQRVTGGLSRADEWTRTPLYEDPSAGGWVAVPEQGQARFLNPDEAVQAVKQGAQPVGQNAQLLVNRANTTRAANGDPVIPTPVGQVAPRPGGISRADEWPGAKPVTPAANGGAAGGVSRADEWPGPSITPPNMSAPAAPAAGGLSRADEWNNVRPVTTPAGGLSRADEWPGASPVNPAAPTPGGLSRADEWPGAASPSTPSAPPPGMTPLGLTQTNPDGSTSDIMWDPATRSTIAVPRAPQPSPTGPAAGGLSRADEWAQPPTRTPGLSRADEWRPGAVNPNAVETAPPTSYRYDQQMASPTYSLTRYVQPRTPDEHAVLGTVFDQSLAMYDAQKAGNSRIPLREVPIEEKAIVADAVGALARGDDRAEWAVAPLQNAARAAWQQENGDPGVDPKFADPNYVARWVNGFLEGKTDLPYQKELADDLRRVGKPAPADIAASQNGPSWIGKFGRDLGAGVKVDNEAKQLTEPQTAYTAQRYGMGVQNTYNVCGPIAANGMLRAANGDDSVPLDKVFQRARDGNYWNGAWTGPVNFGRFLRKEYNKDVGLVTEMSYSPGDLGDMNGQVRMGVRPSEISQVIAEDVTQGKPVTVSISGNNGHYFVATDYDPNNNKFYVGTTGTVYQGGKEWMSLDEMKTKAGGGGIAAIRFNDTLKGTRKGEPFKVAVPGTVQNMDEVDRQSVATRTEPQSTQAVTPQPQFNVYSHTGPVVVNSRTATNGVGQGEIEDFARRAAEARGVHPDAVMALINDEGGTINPVRQNEGGSQAFGPMQLMRGGVGTQFENYMKKTYGVDADVRDPKWWKAATEFGIEKGIRDGGWYDWEAMYPGKGRPDRRTLGFTKDSQPIGISDEALIYAGVKPQQQEAPRKGGSQFYQAGTGQPQEQGYWRSTGPKGVEFVPGTPPPGYRPPSGMQGMSRYETEGPDSTGRLYPGQPAPQEPTPEQVPPPPYPMDAVYKTAQELKGTPPENIDEAYQIVKKTFDQWGMGDPETVAAALATMLVETGPGAKSFKPIKELQNLDGSYVTKPSGGTKFVGRGYVQLTHDYNYRDTGRAITEQTGKPVDLEADPDKALDPEIAAQAMAHFFKSRGIDKMAQEGRWDDIRRAVNGGTTHIDQYRRLLSAMGYGAAPRRI